MRRVLPGVVGAAVIGVGLFIAVKPAPAATAISPGVPIEIAGTGSDNGMGCTLGFLATGADGGHYALTAGHCDRGGDVTMAYRTEGNLRTIGRFAQVVQTPGWAPDIAAIRLDDNELPRDARILAQRAVTGVVKGLSDDDTLCFDGRSSGLQCGTVSLGLQFGRPRERTEGLVFFLADVQAGDSGGPVYRIERDGSATAVGIVNGNLGDLGVVATLVEPYLLQWGLTLDTVRP